MTTAAEALESRREARALRRYVRERAAGRAATEWVTYDDRIRAWTAAASEADATTSGRPWRRVRQPGEPWCAVLGRDLTVARDDALQAVFVALADDDLSGWRRLFLSADRDPERCLSDWRARGRRLLAAVSAEPGTSVGNLAGRFAARGMGKRSLAGV
ncbi:hypothetical protein NS226_04125 [Aureimonas ureilytica]|uniref:Uncharacterized protein n=1 Tax=Aureimonas ureilytica TaxID=401562 RepID=A0A175RCE5_9HYPH|nr:hypothetical protein [Aureimonas ureilytica]KTQ97828.1 hypothetical protein NS226_04125 [Aureimonas ureilytica]